MQHLTHKLGLAIAGILALGCTFDDGQGFATLESAAFSARFEPGAEHDTGDGAIKTDQGYRVTLSRFELGVGKIGLFEQRGAPSGTFEPVVSLPVERQVDVLEGPLIALDRFEPSRELPQANITELTLGLDALKLAGEVSGGALGTATAPLSVDFILFGDQVADLPLTIDRDEPGAFSLAVRLDVDGRLFDGVDFAAHVSNGRIDVTTSLDPAGSAITTSLAQSALHASVD